MKFISTRGQAAPASFGAALTQGLAPDGGLYIPEQWPVIPLAAFDRASSLPEVADVFLRPFVADDAIAGEIASVTRDAFNFAAPLEPVTADGQLSVLELFHGPTAAFKDFGARFLAACMQRLRAGASRPLNILVATSGDTGGAVAAAFHRRAGVTVSVLFPKGQVSPTQERQLTCWGDNVHSYRVSGSFDDCQRLVKEAFVDAGLKSRFELSSANSINLGRLLPQAVYYAATSLAVYRQHGVAPNFIIPSGNLGNSVACVWARKLGLPISALCWRTTPIARCRTLERRWRPRAACRLASAMDVGTPSNMERLRAFPISMRCAVRSAPPASPTAGSRPASRRTSASTARSGARTATRPRFTPLATGGARKCALDCGLDRTPGQLKSWNSPGQRIEMPASLAKLFPSGVRCGPATRTRRVERRDGNNREQYLNPPFGLTQIQFAVVVIGVVAVAFLGFFGVRVWMLRQRDARRVARLTSGSADFLRNVLVPDGNGGDYHLDFVLLTSRGVVIIDLRDIRATCSAVPDDRLTSWMARAAPRSQSAVRSLIVSPASRPLPGRPIEGASCYRAKFRDCRDSPCWIPWPPNSRSAPPGLRVEVPSGWRAQAEAKPAFRSSPIAVA
jgi:threonine synthase